MVKQFFQKCYKIAELYRYLFLEFIYYLEYDVISCKNVENDEKY